ncbi:MAG: type IV pilus secretin PilQ [Pedobacter sp.]
MYSRAKNVLIAGVWLALFGLSFSCQAAEVNSPAGPVPNKLLNVSFDDQAVVFETEKPLNGEYAVYDSVDPLRVVVDFSSMQVDTATFPGDLVNHPYLSSIRSSSFDLSSGQMGRVELVLKQAADFNVEPFDKGLRLVFKSIEGTDTFGNDVAVAQSVETSGAVQDKAPVTAEPLRQASVVGAVQVSEGKVVLVTDGEINKYRHFSLDKPSRLVVDLYQVKPSFAQRSFNLLDGYSNLRIGVSSEKTRFVFDTTKDTIPATKVVKQGNVLQVLWGEQSPAPVAPVVKPVSVEEKLGGPVAVTAVDFRSVQGQSVLSVDLSGPVKIYQPERHGELVRFGVGNATISRSLRRSIDASAFPSAVRLITPYITRKNSTQDVWFAIEFKGNVGYSLRQEGNRLMFIVDDGPFAEVAPQPLEKKILPIASHGAEIAVPKGVDTESFVGSYADRASGDISETLPPSIDKPAYTGQKVTLVFDDANIRNILQLIAEVSNLNIIASDDVKGTITLRLVEVPWDQALELIMDIKDLGMLREGNVVRVMPRDKIRQMQEERFKAARTKEELEDLVTETITVNYSDISTVSEQVSKRKTDRGKVIEDLRNKRIIVTDIPSVVAEIRSLVTLLDLPVKQVLIEARIVEASATFARDLGVKWGLSYSNDPSVDGNDGSIGLGGSYLLTAPTAGQVASAAGLASGLTFGKVGVDKAVLDLRISALENSGQGRIISTPRVTTLNGEEAEISQGTEIPYQSLGSDGQAKTEFKKAELSLKVTPEINPDGSVILEIEAKNDSRGANVTTGSGSAPAIDTKKAETTVLVQDGETTVIGGIFIMDKQESVAGVPWLMNIPGLGYLFKSKSVSEERRELLVFITPRILD